MSRNNYGIALKGPHKGEYTLCRAKNMKTCSWHEAGTHKSIDSSKIAELNRSLLEERNKTNSPRLSKSSEITNDLHIMTPDGPIVLRLTDRAVRDLNRIMKLAEIYRKDGMEVSLVGGPVRDLMMGREPHDFDMTSNASVEYSTRALKKWGDHFWNLGEKFGTVSASTMNDRGEDLKIEVTRYRGDSYDGKSRKPEVSWVSNIEDDLGRRDLTVNSMALMMSPHEPGRPFKLIDPFNGREDIRNHIIRVPNGDWKKSFSDDPLRMMRAARFLVTLDDDARIDPGTLHGMKTMADKIDNVSHERIRDEFSKMIAADDPEKAIRTLTDTTLMDHIIPEISELKRMDETARGRHKPTFDHSLIVLRKAIALEEQSDTIQSPDETLRLAALLHDVGKPKTRRFNGRRPTTFDGHEEVGSYLVRDRLRDMRYDGKVVNDVTKLVRLHMRFHGYSDNPWTDAGVRRYVRDAGDMYDRLNIITLADVSTKKKSKLDKFSRSMDDLQHRVLELRKQEDLDNVRPEVDGNEIMSILGIKPGRVVGKIYKHMLDYRLDNGSVGEDAAVEEVRRYARAERLI